MGMKANSGLFSRTSGSLKFKLNIQHFASKVFLSNGRVSFSSLKNYGQDLIDKSPSQVKNMMKKVGYECEIRPGRKTSTVIVSANPSKERNITQIQVSPDGSSHHGHNPYVKVSTKDIGVIKIVKGSSNTYKGSGEKAKVIFKKGRKNK